MRIIMLGENAPYAEKLLWGLPLREHVRQQAESLSGADVALLLMADAALLEDGSLARLTEKGEPAHLGGAALCLPVEQMDEALAQAADIEACLALLEARGVSPKARLVEKSETRRVDGPVLLAEARTKIQRRIQARLMEAEVEFIDPMTTYVDAGVQIGPGTVVYPGVTLSGATRVGRDCVLLPHSRVTDSEIGDGVTIEQSVLVSAQVGDRTQVGPFAYLRPKAKVGAGCRVGDFVEIKNSVIGDGTKVSHLTYVGDSDLGRDINLGCGVVFVNYDGKRKHRTTVGDHAFIGCNVNLVSPVSVGQDAYIAAGSTVTDDVPPGAFSIARSRQTTKEGWVSQRKDEGKL